MNPAHPIGPTPPPLRSAEVDSGAARPDPTNRNPRAAGCAGPLRLAPERQALGPPEKRGSTNKAKGTNAMNALWEASWYAENPGQPPAAGFCLDRSETAVLNWLTGIFDDLTATDPAPVETLAAVTTWLGDVHTTQLWGGSAAQVRESIRTAAGDPA